MRCALRGRRVAARTALTTTGPKVRFGTKRPSMTSTWIQSAPARSTARTSSASRPKSAERMEGATRTGPPATAGGFVAKTTPLLLLGCLFEDALGRGDDVVGR